MENNLKPGCIVLFCFLLNACAPEQIVKGTSTPDTLEIEKLAFRTYENEEWMESEKYYSELVKREPEESLNWYRLGNIYARTSRPDAAVQAYHEALQHNTEFSRAWYNLGIIQLQQAARSINEMLFHVDPADPLFSRGQRILEGILNLIEEREAE